MGQHSVSKDLVLNTLAFNKLVYATAMHDWNISEYEHLFGIDDAVLIYFAARKLAKQLLDAGKIEILTKEVQR